MLRLLNKVFTSPLHPSICTSSRVQGYIVLVPEIGEDLAVVDALINPTGFPQFNGLTIENCLAAIGKQAAIVEQTVKDVENSICKLTDVDIDKDIFIPLENATSPLESTWGIAKALYLGNSTLMPTKSYLNIHYRARNVRASKLNSPIIYNALKNLAKQPQGEQKRLVDKYLLEGRLNGICLPAEAKIQLNEVLTKLGQERARFKNKLQSSMHQFSHIIKDYSLLRDFPPEFLEQIALDANAPNQGPWKITLEPQIVKQFLKYCPERMERWNIWQADVRKASGLSDKSLENSTHIENIRFLRKRQANILGYSSYAEMSMETKMNKNVNDVKNIFNSLLKHAGPAQSKEIENLQEFAAKSGFKHTLEAFDIDYWQRKQLRAEFNFDEESVRRYFPLTHVIKGLFDLSESVFGIRLVENPTVNTWHPTVQYYDVYDEELQDPVGGIYFDCYSRENRHLEKTGWMVGIRNRNKTAGATPLSALIFNFNVPVYGKPCLLSIEDVQVIFENFGAALQHLLTKSNYSDLAGLSNIEWDASQVCGNVLLNFLDKAETLKNISGHYNTEEKAPSEIINGIKMLKLHMAGHKLCTELYKSHLDMELHSSDQFWLDVVKRLWPIYIHMPLDKKDSHPCSMSSIFSGNWACAYYSQIFSKLIAADIYSAFTENENNEKYFDTGRRFKKTFLTYGGSMSTAEIFRIFRGRDPSHQALLKSLQLGDSAQSFDL